MYCLGYSNLSHCMMTLFPFQILLNKWAFALVMLRLKDETTLPGKKLQDEMSMQSLQALILINSSHKSIEKVLNWIELNWIIGAKMITCFRTREFQNLFYTEINWGNEVYRPYWGLRSEVKKFPEKILPPWIDFFNRQLK